MLDLYKLHIFAMVVREGSFSAAAERLYMTQSGVSQHIKELENSLGKQLFQRGWRGVRLTPHGETLERYTREILALVSQAENALVDVDHLISGRIRIGTTIGIGIYLAPDWVQHFRARYPQLTIALQTAITPQVVNDILSGRLDIGFVEGEIDEHHSPRLSMLVLEDVEQQVIVGSKHPFWERDQLTVEDLRERSMIVREGSSQSRKWLEATLLRHGIDATIGAEFDNPESIKRTLALGMCLAVLPPYMVRSEVEYGLLRMIPVEGSPFMRSLKLLWDVQTPFSPLTRAFLSELSGRFPALEALV